MNIDFRNLLLAGSFVDDLGQVNNRPSIDYNLRPDASTMPSLVIEQISQPIEYNQADFSDQLTARMQIDCFAESYLSVSSIQSDVLFYLNGIKSQSQGSTIFIRIFQDSVRDLPVTDLPGGGRVFQRSADFIIHYKGV